MEDELYDALKEIISTRTEECEGCPFFKEFPERLSWLDYEPEGRVICGLIAGQEGECPVLTAEREEDNGNDI